MSAAAAYRPHGFTDLLRVTDKGLEPCGGYFSRSSRQSSAIAMIPFFEGPGDFSADVSFLFFSRYMSCRNSTNVQCDRMRKICLLLICVGVAVVHGQTSTVTIQTVSNYNQWKWDTTIVMQNDLITLATVPAIGGRVMQYNLGSLPSIMVNSTLFGKKFAPASGGYHNFGGFKNWPSPQNIWPGTWPPPPTLDYGAYTILDTNRTNDSASLSILSPIEKWVAPNIQFLRRTTIFSGSSRVRMEQTIINNAAKDTSWGMWSIVQAIVNHPGKTDSENYWAYFPINPKSVYGAGGVKPDLASKAWKGVVAPDVYGVQFVAESKKIFADPDKGWIAHTSLSDTVVFARTFPVFEGMTYPDNGARTTVYVSGVSASDPLYMEIEVKSPVVLLAANGGRYTFTENWWAAKVRAPILDVDSVGIIAKKISSISGTDILSGIYGVFYTGTAKIAFLDAQGRTLTEGRSHTVTPLAEFYLQETMPIPGNAMTAEVRVYNTKNELLGILERTTVSLLPTAVNARAQGIASEYRLEQNYPNPFNPSTVVSYQLPVQGHVMLRIYDVLGRAVATLVDETKEAGRYEVAFDASRLTSGIYFSRLESNGRLLTKRMTLLK